MITPNTLITHHTFIAPRTFITHHTFIPPNIFIPPNTFILPNTFIHLVQQDNLQYLDFSDGIHLSDSGIRNLVKCYKRVTNPLLGIQANQNQMKPNFRANSHVSNNRDRYK